jgi:hypothetical protein
MLSPIVIVIVAGIIAALFVAVLVFQLGQRSSPRRGTAPSYQGAREAVVLISIVAALFIGLPAFVVYMT